MGLILKYVQKTPAGTFRYRRRVPDDLRSIVGKRELTEFLGDTEKQAGTRYARTHAKFDKVLQDAALKSAGASGVTKRELSELEIYQGLRKRLRELGFDPHWRGGDDGDDPASESFQREMMAEMIATRYPIDNDTGYPLISDPKDGATVKALLTGIGEPPAPTLDDAYKLYLKERIEGKIDEKKNRLQAQRIMKWAKEALDGNVELRRIKRSDAREVRDYLLTETELAPSSVKRYLNTLRAIINHAIKEFDLNGLTNPFNGLEVKREGHAKDDRHPFTAKDLKATRKRVLELSSGPDLPLIWRFLQGTGCRLSEITGLLKADIVVEDSLPHINLVPHPHRRLKTRGSERPVPLASDALEAAKEALAISADMHPDSPYVFPKYADNAGNKRGADGASAALMKHVRAITADKKVTIHSLRHNMKDTLISAGVSLQDQNAILGHSSGGIGESYGSTRAQLEATTRAMKKALEFQ